MHKPLFQVTLEGTPKNPEELDNYYKNKGPIPKFSNDFGCITDVVGYVANVSALGNLPRVCIILNGAHFNAST